MFAGTSRSGSPMLLGAEAGKRQTACREWRIYVLLAWSAGSAITREAIEFVASMQAKAFTVRQPTPDHPLGKRSAAHDAAAIEALCSAARRARLARPRLARARSQTALPVLSCADTGRELGRS